MQSPLILPEKREKCVNNLFLYLYIVKQTDNLSVFKTASWASCWWCLTCSKPQSKQDRKFMLRKYCTAMDLQKLYFYAKIRNVFNIVK